MKSIAYEHAEVRPLAPYMRAIISWNPRSAIDRRLVGKVVTVVARHTTEPDSLWRVSLFNPVQAFIERNGALEGSRWAWLGDGNNVCNSLIEAASLMRFGLKVACPSGHEPDIDFLQEAAARG